MAEPTNEINNDTNASSRPLLLPPPMSDSSDTTTLAVGSTLKLDALGPMVVNSDGVSHLALSFASCVAVILRIPGSQDVVTHLKLEQNDGS